METAREKVKKIYEDKKYWILKSPPLRFIAYHAGISKTLAQRYVKELEEEKKHENR